jgi:hypothetical protein
MEKTRIAAFALAAAVSCHAFAQQSTSYTLEEHTLNSGGSPAAGVSLSSASYQLTLSALGDTVAALGMASVNYQAGAGFTAPYPPPGEVLNLLYADTSTLAWNPEASVGSYTLYRGLVSALASGYGSCAQTGLAAANTADPEAPPAGDAFFYLVAAANRLSEEGSLGADSAGAPRSAPCP